MKTLPKWLLTLSIILMAMGGVLYATARFTLNSDLIQAYIEPSCPQVYKMKFGATINKFLVLQEPDLEARLHLLVPLPITGQSGKIIEIDQVQKKGRRGK